MNPHDRPISPAQAPQCDMQVWLGVFGVHVLFFLALTQALQPALPPLALETALGLEREVHIESWLAAPNPIQTGQTALSQATQPSSQPVAPLRRPPARHALARDLPMTGSAQADFAPAPDRGATLGEGFATHSALISASESGHVAHIDRKDDSEPLGEHIAPKGGAAPAADLGLTQLKNDPHSNPVGVLGLKPIYAPTPPYPELSRRMGEQGTVWVTLDVQPNGEPLRVRIKKSSGYVRLDQAALAGVKRWRFAASSSTSVNQRQVDLPVIFEFLSP